MRPARARNPAELFKSMAGIDLLHVPHKGAGQAVTDLLAGEIDLMFDPAQTVMPHVQAGRLKAFAVNGAGQKMLILGAEPSGNNPEQFARFIRDDMAKWTSRGFSRGVTHSEMPLIGLGIPRYCGLLPRRVFSHLARTRAPGRHSSSARSRAQDLVA